MHGENVLIIDNGAGKIKSGFASNTSPSYTAPNATAKVNKSMQSLVAHQLDNFHNNGSMLKFTRPFDRGYLNNWQCEIDVWTAMFGSLEFKSKDSSLVMTEPPLNPSTLQNDYNEVVFEYYNFKEYCRRPSNWFSAFEYLNSGDCIDENNSKLKSCTIIDSGFSFSHSTAFVNRISQPQSMRRVNIGGKLLTNYLKELVSYRQWNMMDETLLMDQVKEDLCYVSTSFMGDLKVAKEQIKGSSGRKESKLTDFSGSKLKKLFVLPDFQTINRGFAKHDNDAQEPNEQVLTMETERFCVPELLFHPSDIGIDQAGIAEATWQGLQSLGTVDQALAVSSVVLTGGNAR